MTGRIPIRSALSVVVVPSDPNGLKKETPTIAEFYQKNGYSTYFSGKWHLGDVAKFYPIEHGFDEMKNFAAYYPGVYAYSDTAPNAHPWFPKYNAEFWKMYQNVVNLYEWEGTAGKPAIKGENDHPGQSSDDSMSGRPIRQSPTSSSMRKMTSRSSWTSTS